MKYYSTKIRTNDLTYTLDFYTKTIGLPISCHYGHSVLLDEHLLLTEKQDFSGGPLCIYLETEDYDEVEKRILSIGHSPFFRYSPTGQRIMILKDPEGNTIEVGESMNQIVEELLSLYAYRG